MDPASLKGLADAAGQATQTGTAPREPDAMALPEMPHERKPSRRKRSARPSAARHSESPEVRAVPPAVPVVVPMQPCLMRGGYPHFSAAPAVAWLMMTRHVVFPGLGRHWLGQVGQRRRVAGAHTLSPWRTHLPGISEPHMVVLHRPL